MTTITLKLHEDYFDAVKYGVKTFEIRKADRPFAVGCRLKLVRYYRTGKKTVDGRDLMEESPDYFYVVVTYILTHEQFPSGVPEGYVALGIRRVEE